MTETHPPEPFIFSHREAAPPRERKAKTFSKAAGRMRNVFKCRRCGKIKPATSQAKFCRG